MTAEALRRRLHDRLRYKHAPRWRKPFLAPGRFARNQLRRFGLLRPPPGTVGRARAFHLADFTVVSGDPVSEEIIAFGVYEAELTGAFLRLLTPGQVAVDVGMHLGYFTTLFAELVGPGGQVHAFEPTPSTRTLAAANVRRFPQVTVHPFAVWSARQTLTFRDYGPRWLAYNSFTQARLETLGEGTPFPVETITLDEFRESLRHPIALMKIDAESAEREILRGAEKLLAADRPLVSLEVGDPAPQATSRELIEWLTARQYRVWQWRPAGFQPHAVQAQYAYDNLIFAPADRDLSRA